MTTIYELEAQATPKPWVLTGGFTLSHRHRYVAQFDATHEPQTAAADSALTAHCRNNYMEALAALKFAQRELDLLYAHAMNTGIHEAGDPPHRYIARKIKKLEEVQE
jgi:hypothetical protein